MWELADPIASCSDHICSKCWMLEDLGLRVDELESELQTLRHIREGKEYPDDLFQEAVTPGRLSCSNLVSGQGQQGATVNEAGRGILQSGTEEPQFLTLSNRHKVRAPCVDEEKGCRVRDNSDWLERILEWEGEDPVVVVHARTNDTGKTRKEDLRDLYRWDSLQLTRAGTDVLVKW
eukprot:g22888.t1